MRGRRAEEGKREEWEEGGTTENGERTGRKEEGRESIAVFSSRD